MMSYTPKFDYREIDTTSINGQRFYCVGRERYPSITTVLSATETQETIDALNNWRDSMGHEAADLYTERAAAHGTNVHLLCERYFKGEDLYAPDENGNALKKEDIEAFHSLKFKLKNVNEVWGIEVPLYSDLLRVAGRCDLICKYKNKPSIVDYKTSKRLKNKSEITNYAIQLTFYAIAHNDLFNTCIEQGVILMACNASMPMEFKFNIDDHIDDLVERVDQFHSTYK